MLFTCTANATLGATDALAACCSSQISADVNPTCETGKLDALASCLQARGQYIDTCVLSGAKVRTSSSDKFSAGTRAAPPRLGVLGLLTLALCFLGAVLAAPAGSGVQCTQFVPAPRSDWRAEQATKWTPVSADVPCAGAAPCPVASDTGAEWRSAFSTPNAIAVAADIAALVKEVGEPYVGAARLPHVAAQFFVAPGHIGHIRAWAGAMLVPGTFTNCTDEKQYGGSALLVDPTRIGVSLVQKP